MRETISIIQRPRIQGEFRRSGGMNSDSRMADPFLYRISMTAGSGRFYFTQYQGFRQVLGTTQVMPVPSADQRPAAGSNLVYDTIKFPDQTTDTLAIPVNSAIAAVLARYPLPNLPTGSYGANTYATASKVVTNANQFSLRIDHKFSPKDQFLARFNLNNLTGPTTNPDQTAIDPSFAVEYKDRQRNVLGSYTRTVSPRLMLESVFSITRSTPGFPTPNHTDPAVKFADGLFEAFNASGGSVMQAYGNLFHGRQTVSYTAGNHSIRAGVEARVNRDTTYFGTSPNGEYGFGGGTAYATEAIASTSGHHNINIGDPLPDTLSGFLSGSPFTYSVAVAPSFISTGEHMGPAAINRENYAWWVQDTWKVTPRLTLDYGLRWDMYTPISERAHRTSAIQFADGGSEISDQSAARVSQATRRMAATPTGELAGDEQPDGARGRQHHDCATEHLAG